MREATLSDLHTASAPRETINNAVVMKWFVALLAVSFLLRIAYAGHLYQDDGLWFTAAEEILRGKALYREIYFDKPPVLPLVYAALFLVFGVGILTIRLFTIFYSIAVAGVLYLLGSRLYDRRVGLWAGGIFVFFSTTLSSGHAQGFNTDFLAVLPYAAGAYLFVRARFGDLTERPSRRLWLSFSAGLAVAIAVQTNPKAIFDVLFFAVLLVIARRSPFSERFRGNDSSSVSEGEEAGPEAERLPVKLFICSIAGFALGTLPFVVYLVAAASMKAYWGEVWVWGFRYANYQPISSLAQAVFNYASGYFLLNNTLLVGLAFLVAVTIRPGVRGQLNHRLADKVLLSWFAISFLGIAIGGRFYYHYFFQILPSLSLIGARGLTGIFAGIRDWRPRLRRALVALLAILFLVTVIRFHTRTFLLAADWFKGTRSAANADWLHQRLNSEEQMVAARITGGEESEDPETVRVGGPRTRAAEGPSDFVFVWGYRPEIYYWSGLLPASRYLSSQLLTGVPADVHYFGDDYRVLLPGDVTAAARSELLRDLEETRPKYIVDELGFFNSDLSIQSYPELRQFMRAYKPLGATGRFLIYLRRESSKKYRERHGDPR